MKVNKMQKIQIRKMEPIDIPEIVEIENKTFSVPWTEESFVKELSNNCAHYIVLKLDERLIGYGGFWKILDEAHITNVAIKKEYQGVGYGKKLIRKLIDEARMLKIQRMTLEVRESNIRAIKAYKQFGFIIEGKRRRYYTNPIEDAMLMWLSL